ncbi:MAG: hypothetical protein H7296_05160 [Bacteroidia bacterium]|nr:hypothetical protein [Bacteroidia bacterium]
MAKNLIYLSHVFNNQVWLQKAVTMIDSLKTIIIKHPGSFGIWTSTAINLAAGINEIAIIGSDLMPSVNDVLHQYLPNKILQANFNKSDMFLLKDRPVLKELSIYLCLNFACTSPLKNVKELMNIIQLQSF